MLWIMHPQPLPLLAGERAPGGCQLHQQGTGRHTIQSFSPSGPVSTATASVALCQVSSPVAVRQPISCAPGYTVRTCTMVTGTANRGVWSSHRYSHTCWPGRKGAPAGRPGYGGGDGSTTASEAPVS